MNLDELLNKRLVILSGKGGVGKSVLAASLARIAGRQGKNTLLVELDTVVTIPGLFEKPGGIDYLEASLAPNISSFHITGKSALEDYLGMVLKSRRLLGRVFKSNVYEYFVNIAPGLKELMAVGKLYDLEQKCLSGSDRRLHDIIIVDTPATGHTLSYLRMPMTAAQTAGRGFVKREAQKVVDLLHDEQRTSFNIVTTPAEMPVNEAIELYEKVTTELEMPVGAIFTNMLYPPFFSGSELEAFAGWREVLGGGDLHSDPNVPGPLLSREKALLACATSWERRRATQETHLVRLRESVDCPTTTLPYLSDPGAPLAMIRELASALETTPWLKEEAWQT